MILKKKQMMMLLVGALPVVLFFQNCADSTRYSMMSVTTSKVASDNSQVGKMPPALGEVGQVGQVNVGASSASENSGAASGSLSGSGSTDGTPPGEAPTSGSLSGGPAPTLPPPAGEEEMGPMVRCKIEAPDYQGQQHIGFMDVTEADFQRENGGDLKKNVKVSPVVGQFLAPHKGNNFVCMPERSCLETVNNYLNRTGGILLKKPAAMASVVVQYTRTIAPGYCGQSANKDNFPMSNAQIVEELSRLEQANN